MTGSWPSHPTTPARNEYASCSRSKKHRRLLENAWPTRDHAVCPSGVVAAKEIYSQPEEYLGLTKKDLYIPLETETITVNVKESQRALTSIAEEFGTYLLELGC